MGAAASTIGSAPGVERIGARSAKSHRTTSLGALAGQVSVSLALAFASPPIMHTVV